MDADTKQNMHPSSIKTPATPFQRGAPATSAVTRPQTTVACPKPHEVVDLCSNDTYLGTVDACPDHRKLSISTSKPIIITLPDSDDEKANKQYNSTAKTEDGGKPLTNPSCSVAQKRGRQEAAHARETKPKLQDPPERLQQSTRQSVPVMESQPISRACDHYEGDEELTDEEQQDLYTEFDIDSISSPTCQDAVKQILHMLNLGKNHTHTTCARLLMG